MVSVDAMTKRVRYRKDMSPKENIAFVLLFILPWLGIVFLIGRKLRTYKSTGQLSDYLLAAASGLFWVYLFSTADGVLSALVAATLGSMCFSVFLLVIEECRMAKWGAAAFSTPIAVMIMAIILPAIFFQLSGLAGNLPISRITECTRDMRAAGAVLVLSVAALLFSGRSCVSRVSLLSGYFDELPDNEVAYLGVSVLGVVAVIAWPHVNSDVPNVLRIIACVG